MKQGLVKAGLKLVRADKDFIFFPLKNPGQFFFAKAGQLWFGDTAREVIINDLAGKGDQDLDVQEGGHDGQPHPRLIGPAVAAFLVLLTLIPALFLPRKEEESHLLDDEDATAAPVFVH